VTPTERKQPVAPLSARVLAAQVVERVETRGAFAAAALDALLSRYPELDGSTRARTTELVYTTLRLLGGIREQLARHAPRGLPSDPRVKALLEVAATELLAMENCVVPVVVDVVISQIRELRGAAVAGFANAVLRRIGETRGKFNLDSAIRRSCPPWLRERLVAAVGESEADALLGCAPVTEAPGAGRSEPWVSVRLREGRAVPTEFARAQPGRWSPNCRRVLHLGDLRRLPGFARGDFVIEEEGAQLIALSVGARPGEVVLDACAGRGQKTSLLLERVLPLGRVIATDLYPKKLAALRLEMQRLGLDGVVTEARDWSQPEACWSEPVDRVLVDAPCTGTGTLWRRPELMLRLAPEDPERLGRLAAAILRQASRTVRPTGRVVYAVCSVLEEEAERVLEAVADCLTPVPFEEPAIVAALGPGVSFGRLLPRTHGTLGYFLASLAPRGQDS
jgi:16S rRNA (cytosine967-C5)-methyltransferase